MKIRFLKNINSTRGIFPKGTVIEINDDLAKRWITSGFASPVVEYKPETEKAVVKPPEKRDAAEPEGPKAPVKRAKRGRKKKGINL